MASRLQDVLLRGLAAAKPLPTAVANGTLYYSTDTQITEQSDGTAWNSYNDAATGAPAAHHTSHEFGGADAVTLAESQVTNLVTDLAAKASATHAANHSAAGSDPVTLTNLAGFPGGTTNFLRADGTFAIPSVVAVRRQITLIVDNGTSVITTGYKAWISMPVAGTLKKWRILADVSGSIVIDIWKDTYANYPPTVADTITASAKPTLSAALSAENSTLTGWTTAFSAGDVFGFNVDSVTTVKKISLTLEFE